MYSTQMEAAKKGIFTKEMEIVARDEQKKYLALYFGTGLFYYRF